MADAFLFPARRGRTAGAAGWTRTIQNARHENAATTNGAVNGGVRLLLRLEGLAVLAAALAAYAQFGAGWGLFAGLFLLPDAALLAYLAGPRIGAMVYNASHSYAAPLVLLLAGILGAVPVFLALGLVWCAHIGFDRMLGYGLKYGSGFAATHLGRIGQADPW
jgi:hypothetical protein